MSPPVPLFQGRKFALQLVGRTPFHQPHQVADGQFRRDGYEHVDMIARQHATDDFDAILLTDLTANVAHPQLDVTLQNLVPIFCRPHQVITMVKNAMFAGGILRVLMLPRMNLFRFGRFILGSIRT